MRIENKQSEINKLDLEYFIFCVNEKINEIQIENEGFILHNIKMKRLNSEFKQLQIRHLYTNVLKWNK